MGKLKATFNKETPKKKESKIAPTREQFLKIAQQQIRLHKALLEKLKDA
jgi:hypothetical protein